MPCCNKRPPQSAACQVQHGSRDGHLAKPPAGHIFIHSDWGPALDPNHTNSTRRALWLVLPVHPAGRQRETARRINPGTVTVATLSRLDAVQAVEKLDQVLRRNLQALHLQLGEVARHPAYRRLLRVNSGLLPVYTHELGRRLYQEPSIRSMVEVGLDHAGRKAIDAGIRISLHPDQFCVLNSINPATLKNSVDELEYQADILRMMGLARRLASAGRSRQHPRWWAHGRDYRLPPWPRPAVGRRAQPGDGRERRNILRPGRPAAAGGLCRPSSSICITTGSKRRASISGG